MALIKQLVTQTANDAATNVAIETNLTVDGKSGWQINGLSAYWVDGAAVAAADWEVHAILNTTGITTTPAEDDEVCRVDWGLQNTGGVAVAVPLDYHKVAYVPEPRVTVQPVIYCRLVSALTAQANDVIFIIEYEIVKLSDIEVLRLLAGGA